MKHAVNEKTYGYARVSSSEQSQNSNALDQQIDRLKAAGASEILVDVESGWKHKQRPQLEKLMAMVRARKIDQVIVTRLDRLSRQGLKSFEIFEEFLNAGVALRALDEPFDLTTAAGRAMAGQLVVFAQFHSDQKAESIAHGWQHLRDRKVAMNPPFGYIKANNRHQLDTQPFLCLIEEKQEMSRAAIAREIIDIFLTHRTLRLALRQINLRYGLYTFAHTNAQGKRLGGRIAHDLFRFSPTGLRNWLTNPVLQGHLPYLRRQGDRTQIHANTHPDQRLITDEEAREIEKILAHNKQVKGYGSTALKYPCSGLVFCGECRSACYSLSGAKNYHRAKRLGIPVERNYYFQCKNWRLRACNNKPVIRMEVVEDAVIDALTQRAEAIANLASFSPNPPNPVDSPEIQQLQTQLLSLKSIPGANPAIQAAIAQIESQITQLCYSLSQSQETNSVSQNLLLRAFSNPSCWRNASNEDKKRVYRELVEKVVVNQGQIIEVKLKV
ncbi:MAG: fdxN element excision recombinase XisF [Halothece sp.]